MSFYDPIRDRDFPTGRPDGEEITEDTDHQILEESQGQTNGEQTTRQADGQTWSEVPGQILEYRVFKGVPNVQLVKLKPCQKYKQLKEQALREADAKIKQWAGGRGYEAFAHAFRLTRGSIISKRGEINIVTPAHYYPIPPRTQVGVHPKRDPKAVKSIEWQDKSYVLGQDECIKVLDGEIDLLYTRVSLQENLASLQETQVSASLLPTPQR